MSWVFPNVSRPRLLTGIGGVTMTAMGGLAYATAFMSPAAPVIGVAGLGVVVYACVYAKKQAVITWPPLATAGNAAHAAVTGAGHAAPGM